MPGLFPPDRPRQRADRAEGEVFEALRRHLPQGWTAWHSLRLRTGADSYGEEDFVVFVPGRGIVLLEVKGGEVTCQGGIWHQSGREMKPPRLQLHGFRGKLLEALQQRFPGVQAHIALALALPHTSFTEQPSHGDLSGTVLGRQDLPHLDAALEHLVQRLFEQNSRPIFGDVEGALHALWGETWTPSLRLGAAVELREAELLALDQQQLAVLDLAGDTERALVRGGPGSGKTLVASELARRWHKAGKRPLYVCSTSALAERLRRSEPFPASTVRALAAELLSARGVALQDGAERTDWTPDTWESAPSTAASLVTAAQGEWDAIIADEAQDLTAEDWQLVFALAEDKPLWAFADHGQAFWEDRPLPLDRFPARFSLPGRYRCPEALASFADQYRSDNAVHTLPDLGGLARVLTIQTIPTPDLRVLALELILQALLDEGTRPGDIAVLSLGGQTHSDLCHLAALGSLPVRRADAVDADEHVICDTFLRFKGLERPIIIVTELDRARTRYDVRMHIALTRAQVSCVVLATRPEIEADPRLAT